MNFLRSHWPDVGAVASLCVLVGLAIEAYRLSAYESLMWLSLVSLFFHQLEEYRLSGTFPGMLNTAVFESPRPDRYPLNPQNALYVNVFVGWTAYLLAALLGERAVWLGLATLWVSFGNLAAHTIFFNVKGHTRYNAGLVTSWLFFAPCIVAFAVITWQNQMLDASNLVIGTLLGIALNVLGIVKLITWTADIDTPWVFEPRHLWHAPHKH